MPPSQFASVSKSKPHAAGYGDDRPTLQPLARIPVRLHSIERCTTVCELPCFLSSRHGTTSSERCLTGLAGNGQQHSRDAGVWRQPAERLNQLLAASSSAAIGIGSSRSSTNHMSEVSISSASERFDASSIAGTSPRIVPPDDFVAIHRLDVRLAVARRLEALAAGGAHRRGTLAYATRFSPQTVSTSCALIHVLRVDHRVDALEAAVAIQAATQRLGGARRPLRLGAEGPVRLPPRLEMILGPRWRGRCAPVVAVARRRVPAVAHHDAQRHEVGAQTPNRGIHLRHEGVGAVVMILTDTVT